MASGLTRNQMPSNRLRVRLPCPPLSFLREKKTKSPLETGAFSCAGLLFGNRCFSRLFCAVTLFRVAQGKPRNEGREPGR